MVNKATDGKQGYGGQVGVVSQESGVKKKDVNRESGIASESKKDSSRQSGVQSEESRKDGKSGRRSSFAKATEDKKKLVNEVI